MAHIRRHRIIALVAGAAAVLAALVIAAAASGQVGSDDEPSQEEIEATVTALRATVTVVYPRLDENPPDPEFYGPFWLYPAGYEGDWPAVPTQEPCEKPRVSGRDPAVVREANMYVEIREAPPGLTLKEPFARNVCGNEVTELLWLLDGPGGVEISRWRGAFPYEITVPPSHSWLEVEKTTVGGLPAVFLRAKPGEPGPVMIYFADDEHITAITGEAHQFEELVKLAESIAEESQRRSAE